MKKVYLAGPINGCTDEEANGWRDKARAYFASYGGISTIDPMRRDYRGKELDCVDEIVEGDKIDIENCDVFLAMCPKPSAGTAMEIFFAWTLDKPVIIVCPDTPSPWYLYHGTVVKTTEEGLELCRST